MSQILTALTKIQTTRQGTTMSYERSLTFNLRVRGLSEVEITEVLDEVRAHETATGTAAEVEFGTAQEYAKQFPKQKRRTRGKTITTISTALAGAYVLLAVILCLSSESTSATSSDPSRFNRPQDLSWLVC
ncbi:hypothetical protein [Pseudarthrobacter oxydans]|uniref:hypothetical protein n=1 Tax=Pseudarthrobacter oxydans TaxID=1671 RepID=UPI0035E9ACC9